MPNDDPGATHRRGDVAILGVACMLIFMSFATLQGINSSILDPGVAFKSLGSLYVFFAFCNMFAAAFIVERIGCRAALFLASLTYTAFALANVAALYHSDDTDLQVAILIPFSILTGLGASVLWAAQGVYVTRCALKEHVGKYTSLFFGIFWFAQIFGPVLTSALLEAEIDRILVFKILAAVGFSGSILLVYLWAFRPEPSNPYAPIAEANVEINSTTDQAATSPPARKLKFLETLRIMATRSMILLIPLYYTTSIEQAFSGGSLPLFIKTENSTKDLGTKLYLQAVFGTTLMVSSFFIGSVTDRFGSRPLVLLDFFLHVGAMSTLWLLRPLNNFPVLVLCAIALAFSDSLLMNQIYKLLGTLYPRKADTPTAFAAYKFHQSLCTGFMLFGSKSLLDSDNVPKMWAWTLIVGAMLAVAVAGVFAATASYARDGVDGEIVNERTPLLSDGAQGSTVSVASSGPIATASPTRSIEYLRQNNRLGDVLVMSVAFFFIFSDFMVIQGLASSVLPKPVAFKVLGTLYFSFAFCNLFFAAPIVERIGSRAGMLFASLTYSAFNLCVIFSLQTDVIGMQLGLLVPAAILNGLGASVLWASESVYITKCASKDSVGRYAGYFYAWVSCGNLAGPFFSSFLFNLKFDRIQVFQLLFGIGSLGPLLLLVLLTRPPPSNPYDIQVPEVTSETTPLMGEAPDEEQVAESPTTERNGIFKTFHKMISPAILSLAPISYFGSAQMAFSGGSVPLFISTGDPERDLSTKLYLVATMGAMSTVSSALVGPLTDRLGPRRMLLFALSLYTFTMGSMWHFGPYNNLTILFPCVLMFSLCSSIISNQGYKIMGVLFAGDASAFAAQRFHGSLGTGFAFMFSEYLLDDRKIPNMDIWAPMVWGLLLVGVLGAFFVTKGARFQGTS